MTLSGARRAAEPLVRRLLHLYWRFARGMTFGVRALVDDVMEHIHLENNVVFPRALSS